MGCNPALFRIITYEKSVGLPKGYNFEIKHVEMGFLLDFSQGIPPMNFLNNNYNGSGKRGTDVQ